MATPQIQLIAIDLDGTLLTRAKEVCPRAAEALLELPARGVRVVIASARPPRSVRHIYRALNLDTWQINYNGALIWDEPGQRAVHHAPLDGARVLQIAREARKRFEHVVVSCEILDRWFTDRAEHSHTTETGRLFKPDVIAPLEEFCHQPITKLLFLGEPAMILQLEQSLAGREDISMVRSDPDLIQIMDRKVDKGSALRIVAEHYQVATANVLAIGDALNDIPMLQAAGVGVAMGNAHPAVKAVVEWIAPSNDDQGVHAALERYGLA